MTDKKIAVVTGATRGMGFETCRALLKNNFHVILTGRTFSSAVEAVAKLSDEENTNDIDAYELDVTSRTSADKLATYIRTTYKRLDLLVNNAGAFFEPTGQEGYMSTSLLTATSKALEDSFLNNTLGAVFVCQALVPIMVERNSGRIINISSVMGSLATMDRGWPAYRLSKTALNAVTGILASELKETNVKINSVCPGWVRTNMGGPYAAKSVEEGIDTTIWLATNEQIPNGGFYTDRHLTAW